MKSKAEKFYIQHLKATPIVLGRPFPIDMLRYDRCVPRWEEDSSTLAHALSGGSGLSIHLIRFTPNNYAPTYRRWESFGWRVEIIEPY